MAQGIQITLDLIRLEMLENGLKPRAELLLEKVARDIEADAKEKAPVDTGALRSSIHVEKEKDLERTVADGVEYGVFQEFGTSRMAAHPFLTPAVENNRKPFLQAWEELFK